MVDEPLTFSDRTIPVGKAPAELLQRLLRLERVDCPNLIVPPAVGEDSAVLRLGSRLLAVASDPITFATPSPGYFAVHVNANDIAVTGALPRYFTLTLMLPEGTTERQVADIMADALAAAREVGATLLGGHTEVTEAVRLPIVSVSMFGELLRPDPVRTGDGRPGDAIIQIGALGIEGTAILASEYAARLRRELDPSVVEAAADLVFHPGLSVVAPAVFAASRLPVHAMHDPTEGGIATGLRELAAASDAGIVVREADLLLREETTLVCSCLDYDPLGLISSGCLLLTLAAVHVDKAVALLCDAGFPVAHIGFLTPDPSECTLELHSGARVGLPSFAVDELARPE